MDSSNLVVWGSNEHGQIGLPPDAHTGHQGKAERVFQSEKTFSLITNFIANKDSD